MKTIKRICIISFLILYTVLSTLSLTLFTNAEESAPVIQNPSFEQTTSKLFMNKPYLEPTNWTTSLPSFYSTRAVSDYKYDGNYSIKLPSYTEVTITSSQIAVQSGKEYEFGLMVLPTESNGSLKITIADTNSVVIAENSVTFTSCGEWQPLCLTAKIPQGVSIVKFNVVRTADSVSDCYVDAVYGKVNEAQVISTIVGASLRLATNSSGIRFAGKVDKEFFNSKANAVAGILIVPTDYLAELSEFTFSALKSAGKNYLDIPALKWNNIDTADTDGFYGFYCAMTNVKPQNITRKFSAISYLKYTENEKEVIIYGNYTESENSRSIKEVAISASENIEDYDLDQQEIIKYYINYNG